MRWRLGLTGALTASAFALADVGSAGAVESLPSESFAAVESPSAVGTGAPSDAETVAFAPAPANPKSTFSLGEFFSHFLELGSPGDPNHPDKIRLTLTPNVGYDSNVFTANTNVIASATTGLSGLLAYNFGNDRLKIASSLALGATYYDNRPGDNTDYNGSFNLATSYFVTRRLQISANASVAYLSQPNPTLIGGASRFSGDYTATTLGLGLNYSIRPRLSLRLQYKLNSIKYVEEAQNQSLGFTEQNYVIGFDYLLQPRLTLTLEYRYTPLNYVAAGQNSDGHILTVGFVASINPRLKWTLQGGAEARLLSGSTTANAPSQYIGPFLESDLEYDFSPNSSLVGTLRYGTEPSGSAGISIRQTLRGSLSLHYAFTGRLGSDLGISYEHDRYDQPGTTNDFTQEYYTAFLGLRYQLNPAFAVSARYDYSKVTSQQAFDGYTRGVTSLGLEIIF
jgi:predicted porin